MPIRLIQYSVSPFKKRETAEQRLHFILTMNLWFRDVFKVKYLTLTPVLFFIFRLAAVSNLIKSYSNSNLKSPDKLNRISAEKLSGRLNKFN